MMNARRVARSLRVSNTTPQRTQRKLTLAGTEVPPQSA